MKKTDSFQSGMWALYSAAIVAMNVLAAKQFDFFGLTVTCGILVSGFVFIAQDLVTELYGANQSRKMISTCYIIALTMVLLFQAAIFIPPSQFWFNQEAFTAVLKTTLRITIASITAYYCGSFANVYIMSKLKERYSKSLFVRAVTSTLVGQLLDNTVFAIAAFAFVLPANAIKTMAIGGTLIEIATEIVCFPVLKIIISKRDKAAPEI